MYLDLNSFVKYYFLCVFYNQIQGIQRRPFNMIVSSLNDPFFATYKAEITKFNEEKTTFNKGRPLR